MKKVLALDVAYAHLGWALIEPYRNKAIVTAVGCIHNSSDPKKKKVTLASNYTVDRIAKVYRELKDVYVVRRPNCVIAEIPTGGAKSNTAAAGMAMGQAIVTCLITEFDVSTQWTTPTEGKIALCGSKTASKIQMQHTALQKFPELREMVKKSTNPKSLSGLEGWFEHSADAVAAFLAARSGSLVRYLADDNGEYNPDPTLF